MKPAMSSGSRHAGIKRTFHDLRRTAATNLISAGIDASKVAMIMGWSEEEIEALKRKSSVAQPLLRVWLRSRKKEDRRTLPEQSAVNQGVNRSFQSLFRGCQNPYGTWLSGCIAQLVEQLTLNQRVVGSNPTAPTTPQAWRDVQDFVRSRACLKSPAGGGDAKYDGQPEKA